MKFPFARTTTDTEPDIEPDADTDADTEPDTGTEVPTDTVEVRRNGTLAAGVAGVAGLVALAYLVRALGSGALLDWVVFLALAALAAAHAASWRDARSPLLVADRTGIRVRLGRTWQGLPWAEVEEVEHAPRRGLLRDGRLVAFPVDGEAVVARLGGMARRQALVAERMHGAPFAVPLGLTTTVAGAPDGLTSALLGLVPDPELVVEVVDGEPEPVDPGDHHTDQNHDLTDTAERPLVDESPGIDDTVIRPRPVVATGTPAPLRDPVASRRTEVSRGATAVRVLPDEVGAEPALEDTGVWHSETVVIDELAGPAVEPIIGPELTRAREALGLSIERLAERTRIRPHVIESIEVDDFTPCGGDFYARGHVRTLARVLGVDATPLLATYDETYADAPIDARKVFEAELSTGSDGAIRSLRGGPNWSVLVAGVMAVVLAWSVARLVLDRPDAAEDAPSLAGDSAGLTSGRTSLSPPVPVVITAEGGGAKVVVRDGGGAVVFKGDLAFGQSKTVKASPPVRVQTSDGSLTVGLAGADPKRMGRTGESSRGTFVPPSS